VTARTSISIKYTGNTNPLDNLGTAIPVNGVINYPEHIAPLWSRDRGANTCTTCHSDPAKLDLSATMAGTGRLASYERLMIGDPVLDSVTGLPVTRIEEGVPVIVRQPALVNTMASEGDALGLGRKSRLVEIMWGDTLSAGSDALTSHPNPPGTAPNHATLLNPARSDRRRPLCQWAVPTTTPSKRGLPEAARHHDVLEPTSTTNKNWGRSLRPRPCRHRARELRGRGFQPPRQPRERGQSAGRWRAEALLCLFSEMHQPDFSGAAADQHRRRGVDQHLRGLGLP
jgi:hypothetical protein